MSLDKKMTAIAQGAVTVGSVEKRADDHAELVNAVEEFWKRLIPMPHPPSNDANNSILRGGMNAVYQAKGKTAEDIAEEIRALRAAAMTASSNANGKKKSTSC